MSGVVRLKRGLKIERADVRIVYWNVARRPHVRHCCLLVSIAGQGTIPVLEDDAYCKKDIGIHEVTEDAHWIEHAHNSAKLQGFLGVPFLFLDTRHEKK